jgi:hypothetical protein
MKHQKIRFNSYIKILFNLFNKSNWLFILISLFFFNYFNSGNAEELFHANHATDGNGRSSFNIQTVNITSSPGILDDIPQQKIEDSLPFLSIKNGNIINSKGYEIYLRGFHFNCFYVIGKKLYNNIKSKMQTHQKLTSILKSTIFLTKTSYGLKILEQML